jgi:molybdopterin molybdotransferase
MALMSVAEAQARILDGVTPLNTELVTITEASGRVLASDLAAKLTQPPFNASAMDGYAVRAADVAAAPARLRLAGAAAAGHAFTGSVGAGEAVRIFTGAPVPEGADTIVIQENTSTGAAGTVEILEAAKAGRHVRPLGYDFREGEILLKSGARLQSRHLMLAAAMNHAEVPVRRRPVVAVLATGDELVRPGEAPKPDQIISSVPAALNAALQAWGAEAMLLDIARDTQESLSAQIEKAKGADILLTIGGASVGELDLVHGALKGMGARFDVLKVAMRPGKPLMFGFKGPQRVLSLPGNPVSAVICARVFLKPLLDRLLGVAGDNRAIEKPLACAVEPNGEREHYMRARIIEGAVAPLSNQDSSLMRAFLSADCLAVRPAYAPALPEGALVPVLPLDF